MEAYQTEFEKLMNDVDDISESTLMSYFMGGLKPELQGKLIINRPPSLRRLMAMARMLESNKQRFGGSRFGSSNYFQFPVKKDAGLLPTPTGTSTGAQRSLPIVQRVLTEEEKRARRAQGLCYNCNSKFTPGHKCEGRLFRLDADSDCLIELVDNDCDTEFILSGGDDNVRAEAKEISLNALSGSFNPRTMRMSGSVLGHKLSIMVDDGSTNNFIQGGIAEKLGLPIEPSNEFRVFVGSGDFLWCRAVCKRVPICIQGLDITEDFFILAMEGANLVLGVQWLQTLGPVTKDHKALTMDFKIDGKEYHLQGDCQLNPDGVTTSGLKKMIGRGEVAYFCHLRKDDTMEQDRTLGTPLSSLLDRFKSILDVPNQLPPLRAADHRIVLQEGSKPVNVHPYRYPHFQKNEIERLTGEMLAQGLIRESVSPFSSPVLLVKKKDGDFRFRP